MSDSEFEWNFFEKSSLECAMDESQRVEVLSFWMEHIPFCASVADGYSYIAFRLSDGAVVLGTEPEYEESAKVISNSMENFFELFVSAIRSHADGMMARFLGNL